MVETLQQDYLVRGRLADLDPEVAELIRHETARQARTIIMVPSESTIPEAVREAVGSAFHNIYAEGYPTESMRHMDEADILDYNTRLTEYRRNADDRYYKGTEYANIVESLARRRAAKVFANERIGADDLYVNVQPLSGAPANNAVYTALIQPGDTLLSMDLIAGGHLSHGSPVNRSGKQYNIISYAVDPATELLNYETIRALAIEHKPKIIIGGYSSYPIAPDWEAYRAIADEVGAWLLADVAHFAGLVAAGAYPSPVGVADIVTFTTHKTLNGPRGAVIITHDKALARKLDRGVFPGEQGGPHMNSVAGLAVALKFAQTEQFQQLQHQTVTNTRRLAQKLSDRGLRVVHGGSDSHMIVIDLKPIVGADGTSLSGDMAARILDLIGVVCNRQTIPGDTSPLRPNGIRLGLPWMTQRGATVSHVDVLSDVIADVLLACQPFSYTGRNGARAKIDFDILQNARLAVRDLIDRLGIDTDVVADGYPHFTYLDDAYRAGWHTFAIRGHKASAFLDVAVSSDVRALVPGDQQATSLHEADGTLLATGWLEMVDQREYRLTINENVGRVAAWLRSLSDGFVVIDLDDIYAKVPGPVDVDYYGALQGVLEMPSVDEALADKLFYIGKATRVSLPEFTWQAPQADSLLKSALWDVHQALGARTGEFAGYEMPLWYSSVQQEHLSVRNGAGIFDVTHMGVWEVSGSDAEQFLDTITTNDVQRLAVGDSHYTFFLDENGLPLDDLLLYRLDAEHFFVVVNASNNDKNWAWVRQLLNHLQPHATVTDLRAATTERAQQRVDIALQGPHSRDILLKLASTEADHAAIKRLPWAGITRVTLDGLDLIVSRTGYTGERIAYELFVQPDAAPNLFNKLVELGATPCGLAARDSLRIEAGLPLYGHELAGPLQLDPSDAGMGAYVKLYKPSFIGKQAFVKREQGRDAAVTRFRMDNKGARPAHQGDPIVDGRGRVVGIVTSCSVDSEGYQLGQAYLKQEWRKRGTQLGLFAGTQRWRARDLNASKIGDRANMPEPITILSRFPKRK